MHMILLNQNGRRVDAILLAAGRDRMRVVVNNSADTMELRRKNQVWTADNGEPFEFEFMQADGMVNMAAFYHHLHHRTADAA